MKKYGSVLSDVCLEYVLKSQENDDNGDMFEAYCFSRDFEDKMDSLCRKMRGDRYGFSKAVKIILVAAVILTLLAISVIATRPWESTERDIFVSDFYGDLKYSTVNTKKSEIDDFVFEYIPESYSVREAIESKICKITVYEDENGKRLYIYSSVSGNCGIVGSSWGYHKPIEINGEYVLHIDKSCSDKTHIEQIMWVSDGVFYEIMGEIEYAELEKIMQSLKISE